MEQLIREAKAAIKMGDKASARAKLQEAVGIDQYSEQGWYWLAAVVETDDERKVCLGNVVVINPKNKRAQEMLDRLSGNLNAGLLRDDAATDDSPRLTGEPDAPASRKILMLGGAAAAGILGLILILVLVKSASAPPPLPTLAPSDAATVAVVAAATNTVAGVATGAATEGSTQTPTLAAAAPTLPPTWTPQPSPTRSSGAAITPLPPPPPGLTGRLVAISGSMITAKGNLPVFVVDLQTGKLRQVSSDVGDYAILTHDGQRLIFSRYIASTDSKQLRLSNANGTQPGELSRLWGNLPPLADVVQPSLSRNGTLLAFSASSLTENDSTPDIYVVPTTSLTKLSSGSDSSTEATAAATEAAALINVTHTPTAEGTPAVQVKRVTGKDSGNNTWPALSPDGSKIVYINDGQPLGNDSIDIFVVSATGGTPKNLTNDNLTTIEGAPEYSPDGSKIAYHAAPQGSKTNHIYVMDADGTNKVQLTEGAGDNIRPHWSPDGKYIAFSSTRSGKWEIYVIALDTKTVYQVTQTQASTICTGWSPQ